jgi:ribonuclease Z
LNEAKRAVRHGAPDDSAIHIRNDLSVPLGVLKQHALRTAPGHRIAYVVDAAFYDSNVASASKNFITWLRRSCLLTTTFSAASMP